jgi:hypothetical protein
LAGLTKGTLERYLVHFSASEPSGILASNFVITVSAEELLNQIKIEGNGHSCK